jgi:hypothetical protein
MIKASGGGVPYETKVITETVEDMEERQGEQSDEGKGYGLVITRC